MNMIIEFGYTYGSVIEMVLISSFIAIVTAGAIVMAKEIK